jgi:hypothetical protein
MVEHAAVNRVVVGSSPTSGAISSSGLQGCLVQTQGASALDAHLLKSFASILHMGNYGKHFFLAPKNALKSNA